MGELEPKPALLTGDPRKGEAVQRKSFGNTQWPIARRLERVGEWWSILLMRRAFHGLTRLDQFQKSLEIAPNILARRLASLVDAGLLGRRRYSEHPPRCEYLPTERAQEFRPILWLLNSLGTKHLAPEAASVLIVNRKTGRRAEPIVVDRVSGRPIGGREFKWFAGPAADERTRKHYAERDAAAVKKPAGTARNKHTVARAGARRNP